MPTPTVVRAPGAPLVTDQELDAVAHRLLNAAMPRLLALLPQALAAPGTMAFVVLPRNLVDPRGAPPDVQRVLAGLGPEEPFSHLQPIEEVVEVVLEMAAANAAGLGETMREAILHPVARDSVRFVLMHEHGVFVAAVARGPGRRAP